MQLDSGPEFISRAVDQWAFAYSVALYFIEPGKPTQHAFIESFNGKFRDECLNQNWFTDLDDARQITEAWRVDYNTVRAHSSLGYQTPEAFAQEASGRAVEKTLAWNSRGIPTSPQPRRRPPLALLKDKDNFQTQSATL